MSYLIFLKKSAEKELLALPKDIAFKVKEAITKLVENPRPKDSKKLTGSANDYRIRIGNYRVVYTINDREITIHIIKIAHRKEVYR